MAYARGTRRTPRRRGGGRKRHQCWGTGRMVGIRTTPARIVSASSMALLLGDFSLERVTVEPGGNALEGLGSEALAGERRRESHGRCVVARAPWLDSLGLGTT